MAVTDHPIKVRDSFVLAEAWTDTIGGYQHSEIIISNPEWHAPEYLEGLEADGWVLTRYVREDTKGHTEVAPEVDPAGD